MIFLLRWPKWKELHKKQEKSITQIITVDITQNIRVDITQNKTVDITQNITDDMWQKARLLFTKYLCTADKGRHL